MVRVGGTEPGVTAPLRHPALRGLALGRALMAFGNDMASAALAAASSRSARPLRRR